MKDLSKFVVREHQTVIEAIGVIQGNASRCAIVTNDAARVIGVFSEGDVLRAILQGTSVYAPLSRMIAPSFKFLRTRDLRAAIDMVRKHGITLVPVLSEDFMLVDVVTIADLLVE